ncbi:potassium/proton antiporter, CPA1 family [Algoriphagus faecimaris]|uniref:Potassium/proton antiporter, CPA1 family n=1 Tax=Algoriphagus faecimaris TaxID=686796 RepID=A0A1G6RY03_9BACT|nr:potassium/proton antiporter [Algoriphagus faecimaris]SDD09560.1 potassium/proton antiporter, CPA1 family [Algoriphagus faecimaris]
MNLTSENILLIGSSLLIISILIGKSSSKFGVPILVLFLALGMIAGSDGIIGIHFDNPTIAQFIGVVSLNFILFSGGLETDWKTVRPVLWEGISLSTVGVLATALSLGLFIHLVTDFTLYEGLLLGAIVSSTDAAAVFSILRSKSIALKSNLRPTLELESGSNDPMAYVLTISFLSLVINPEKSIWEIIPVFLSQMIIGGLIGLLFGRLSKSIINMIKLGFEGLYPVMMIGIMFFVFSFADFLGGNGFLAIYIAAVYIGNQELIHKKSILKFFDGVAWLMQIVLFLTLGLLVFPSQLLPYLGIGILIALFQIIFARPIGVYLSLFPFKMKNRRRLFISWVGLRGAVPIVFATYPLIAGIDKAPAIFNIVFFISLLSVLLQGTTLGLFAKWLHVALPEKAKPKLPIDQIFEESTKTRMEEIEIKEGDYPVEKRIVDLGFPKGAIIAMIKRGENYITPNGYTEIKAGDILIVLSSDDKVIKDVYKSLSFKI